jgi:hypothetical protein
MSRKLAAIANLKALSPAKKVLLGATGLGAAGLGIENYLDSVSMPPSDELLMMDLPSVPEDKSAAVRNDAVSADTSLYPTSRSEIPSPPIGMSYNDMFGTRSTNPTPYLPSAAPSGESSNPRSEAVSATGSKQTSSGKAQGIKNASFMEGGILPAALGGIGGYMVGEHFIAPHFARQQAAIAEQMAKGQTMLDAAVRNQRLSPILAAAAGAILLSLLLSSHKKQEVREHMGGPGGSVPMDLQGFDPHEQRAFSVDQRNIGY